MSNPLGERPGMTRGGVLALLDPIETRLEAVETATGASIIYVGRQNAPVAGTSAIGNTTYLLENTVTVSGIVVGIDVWGVNGGGTLKIGRWRSSGGNHAIVPDTTPIDVTVADGLNQLVGPGDFAPFSVEIGERFGLFAYSGNGKIMTTSGAPGDLNQWFNGGTGYVTSFTDSGASGNSRMEIRFHIQQSSLSDLADTVTALTTTVTALETKSLTLENSDLIMVIGDSITENYSGLPGKGWVSKAAAGTDWRFETYSESGRTVLQIITRIVAGATLSGSGLTISDYNATTALIALGTNDDDDSATIATFQDGMRRLVEMLRGMGYQRICLLCPHGVLFDGTVLSAVIRALASELGCDFINVRRQLVRMVDFDNRYTGFVDGVSHLGPRLNDVYRAPVEAWVRSLGRPRTGIKLFRKRSGVSVTDPEDLNYWTLYDRERLFRELGVGEFALNAATRKYYDELDDANDVSETVNSEYGTVVAGTSTTITAGDWGLIEAVLPYTAQNLTSVTLTLTGATGVTVYVRDAKVASSSGDPVGDLTAVAIADGVYTFSQAVLLKAMDGDKLPIWITKSGGVAVTDVSIGYTPASGAVEKRILPEPAVPVPLGTELLGEPLVDGAALTASWTVTGTVTATSTPPGSNLAQFASSTEVAPVDSTNYIAQAVTWSADNFDDQEFVVSVTAGIFPAIFDSTDTYPDDAPITSDSFDWGTLVVELIYTAPTPDVVAVLTGKVGLWWNDLRWVTTAPPGTTGCTVRIRSADAKAVYIDNASVKMVAA